MIWKIPDSGVGTILGGQKEWEIDDPKKVVAVGAHPFTKRLELIGHFQSQFPHARHLRPTKAKSKLIKRKQKTKQNK